MLIRITRHCSMGCSHCMMDARPDGRHMTMGTLVSVAALAANLPAPVLVTGGEPFEHPDFEVFVSYLLARGIYPAFITVVSNGVALQDPKNLAMIEDLGVTVQVTNDPRYYPKAVTVPSHPQIIFFDKIPTEVIPIGRGRAVAAENPRKSPDCFNLRSVIHSGYDLHMAVAILSGRGRFCVPAIDYDGAIRLGEHCLCPSVGHASDSIEKLTTNIRRLRCGTCGMYGELDRRHLEAIGEA